MRAFLLMIVMILLAGCTSDFNYAQSSPGLKVPRSEIASTASRYVLLVTTKERSSRGELVIGNGSAFIAEYKGYVGAMTAWHVVAKDPDKIVDLHGNGITREVGPFYRVRGRSDVAFAPMRSLPREWSSIPIIERPMTNYGDCVAWGYPKTEDRLLGFPCRDEGISTWRSGFMQQQPDQVYRDFSGIAIKGMSGGPIIKDGRVIGLVSATAFPGSQTHYVAEIPR